MKRREGRAVSWLVTLFFLSGAAGLGYQVVWAKAFGLGVGHEYPAALAVVTAFMAGMALGGLIFERLPRSFQEAPRAYGWLELIIAIWGVITIVLIPSVNRGVIHLLGESPSFWRHWSVVFGAVLLSLLPATSAMGATLPAMERLIALLRQKSGMTALVYAANTGGAMVGAVVAAFWAISWFGLRDATFLFAALNAVCALLALWCVPAATNLPKAATVPPESRSRGLGALLLITGVLGIGFETVMIRALNHVLENTIYTFAVVLAVYLFGTALGAAIYQRRSRVSRIQQKTLFTAVALACLVSALLLRWMPAFYESVRNSFGDSLIAVAAAESTIALSMFLVPAIFMGATFCALAELSLQTHRTLGWSVSLNSLGSAAAPILFGLFVIPVLGLKLALGLIVVGYATLARPTAFWLVPACALLVPLITSSTDLIRKSGQQLAFFREGVAASVAVLESTNAARVLKVNNRFQMGGTAARIAEERHADIPLLLHPQPRRALFIGLGTGITFATAAYYPDLVADGIELLPEVAEAMPLFQESPELLKTGALRVRVADGRRFVLTTTNQYDVIVGDLFHPAQDGAGFLFTREHFAAVRERLRRDGLFCQWLPLFQMDLKAVDIVARTFQSVFPTSEMWLLRFNVDTPAVGLIGWNGTSTLAIDSVESKAARSELLAAHLRKVALGDTLRLAGCRLGRVSDSTEGMINTDEHPVILFHAPYVTFRRRDDPAARLLSLLERFSDQSPLTSLDANFLSRLQSYIRARDVYLRGLAEEGRGEPVKAVNLYIESSALSPDFTSGYAKALGIATALAAQNPQSSRAILLRLIEAQPDRPVARQLLERMETQ